MLVSGLDFYEMHFYKTQPARTTTAANCQFELSSIGNAIVMSLALFPGIRTTKKSMGKLCRVLKISDGAKVIIGCRLQRRKDKEFGRSEVCDLYEISDKVLSRCDWLQGVLSRPCVRTSQALWGDEPPFRLLVASSRPLHLDLLTGQSSDARDDRALGLSSRANSKSLK